MLTMGWAKRGLTSFLMMMSHRFTSPSLTFYN